MESQLASALPFWFINSVGLAVQLAITGEQSVFLQSLPSAGDDCNLRREVGSDYKLA